MTNAELAAIAVAAAGSAVAVRALVRWRARLPQAMPSARSLHVAPVPRVGGIALWAGFLPAALVVAGASAFPLALWLGPWMLLVTVSLADDVRAVPVLLRLAVQLAAAAWFASGVGGSAELAPLAMLAIVLVVVWMGNLYNFMDGSDGLAVAMAIVGFTAYAALLWARGLPSALPLAVAVAALPLFAVNRPPARMFLGDVGAVPLGFLAAAFGVWGALRDVWPAWFPLLVFLPFVADATVTLLRRLLRGERVWEAHKSHYYQRLHQLGAGHRGTLAVYGVLMLGTAGSAVALAAFAPAWGVPSVVAWCTVCALLFAAIDYHWRRKHVAAS